MQKPNGNRVALTAAALRQVVVREIAKAGSHDSIDPESVVVVGGGRRWHAALRPDGGRLDETMCAAVAAIAQRLVGSYDLTSG
jgi:hypothetical protein